MHRHPTWRRGAAVLVLAALALSHTGCVAYRWRTRPLTDVTLAQEKIDGRRMRFTLDGGTVTLDVKRLAFPWAEGIVVGEATAPVSVALSSIRRAERVESVERATHTTAIALTALPEAAGQRLLLETQTGPVSLVVATVGPEAVVGTLVPSAPSVGQVRVDLRDVRRVEVREGDAATSVAGTLGIVVGVAAAVFLVVMLTKESCPFVYVDRGRGFELVGEAYAGAAFRSIQRDDLLPLPVLEDGRVRVMLRNEARETQYTDEAALVVVDHAPELRALSTFDAKIALVDEARLPVDAQDGSGRSLLELLEAHDGRRVESSPEQLAERTAAEMETIVATFANPGRAPVLEIVGGNTPWLDLVFGRFFATMGGRLDRFLAAGNEAGSGPGIRAWRQREGVDLSVEVREGGAWRPVATVPTAGPIALRRIAVPLPPAADGADVTVRLRSGPGFWRIDQLALSSRATEAARVHRLAAHSATTTGGAPQDAAVAVTDGRFNALSLMNEALTLTFDLPPVAPGSGRSAFLFTNGYYNVHLPIQARWDPGTLRAIRQQPGGLTRLSRDLAAQYVERARAQAGGTR